MSVNFLKSFFEGQEVKTSTNASIAIEFNKKFTYFSFVQKFIEKQIGEKKKVFVINFDLLFYKFILTKSNISKNSNCLNIFHMFSNSTQDFSRILSTKEKYSLLIIGLDLLSEERIHNFFLSTHKKISQSQYTTLSLFIFSIDNSYNNLNDQNERKKEIIKSRVNYYLFEKMNKINQSKNLLYVEVYNLSKLTKDIAVFEYTINKQKALPIDLYEFEKISILLKEYKDLFESNAEEERVDKGNAETEPVSTFKLTLNDKELQAKNEVVLPYLKVGADRDENRNRIIIDQDDLNELYEEDPDGDLDI